ncbi:hypothetical protein [Nostoc sp.]|uniref:hypothetical protein n=1 Tax=Nostoc sp. TaxID=1180 RepID=UPI002FF859DB
MYKAITSGKASCRNPLDCIKLITSSLDKGATIATDAPPVEAGGVSLVGAAGVSLFSGSETGRFDGIVVGRGVPFPKLMGGRGFQGRLPTGTVDVDVGLGVDVGVGLGVDVGVGLGVDVGVGLGVDVGVGLGVDVGVGLGVDVGVGLGVDVGVGLGVGTLCCLKGWLLGLEATLRLLCWGLSAESITPKS